MKTHLVLLVCLSVLLSGCITAITAISEPEPDSGGDWVAGVFGGCFDVFIFLTGTMFLGMGIDPQPTGPNDTFEPPPWAYLAGVGLSIGIIVLDVIDRNDLPYRKAYYEDKEAEEEATDTEQEK